jgi:cell division protein FtsW
MRDRLSRADQAQQSRRHRPDYWLLILSIALLAVGVIVVYSIGPALGKAHGVSGDFFIAKQGIAIGIGLLAFFITSRIPTQVWRQLTWALVAVAGLVTLVALIMPVDPQYPAHRWIRLGGFSFQSVELVKFALLVWLAGMLAGKVENGTIQNDSTVLKPLAVVFFGLSLVVAIIQSDLGSMMVIIAMMAMMAYVAGLPLKRLGIGLIAIALVVVMAVSTTPYRRERLATFFHPTADCQSTGYQACQALIAVGSGGTVGLGLGGSVQAYGYLPEAANDSIFAIYAEKFGFVGVTVLLAIFVAFFSRLKGLAQRAPDNFSRLVVMGILAWLATQTIINIGAMLGLLPLKGITLPLVSYGGTSVVFILAALGVVFNISRYTTYAVPSESKEHSAGAFNRQSIDRGSNRNNQVPQQGQARRRQESW